MTDYSSSSTSTGTNRSFGTRALTAMFSSRDAADAAVKSLLENGFRQEDVRLVPGYEKDRDSTTADRDQGGFWASLSDFFFPEDDRHSYAEGLSRGHYLVTVNTTDANHERALDILDDEGTIDMDEREDEWRSQGWTGYAGAGSSLGSGSGSMGSGSMGSGTLGAGTGTGLGSGSTAGLGAGSDLSRSGTGMTGRTGLDDGTRLGGARADLAGGSLGEARDRAETDSGSDWASRSGATSGAGLTAEGRGSGYGTRGADVAGRDKADEVIPVAEENLKVGKREVEGGRVRVRSYVVERPVEEQVTLRREHVDVQRRPVDRALSGSEDPFRERTVEMEERRQEPVVSKEARIREEVSLRKDVQDEQRTVSDTVRRTEVEVDDQRSAGRTDERRRS